MSQDQNTKKELEAVQISAVDKLITSVPEKNTLFTLSKQLDEEDGQKIVVRNENILHLEEPKKFKVCHRFENLKSFMIYIDKYKTRNTTLYYDKPSEVVHCVFDELKTDGYPEIIKCSVSSLGLDTAIGRAKRISTGADFLNWLKDNKRNVPDFRDLYYLMSAIKVSSKVERINVTGKQSELSYNIKTNINGVEKGEPVELPDSFNFLYNDYSLDYKEFETYKIECDLYYRTDSDHNLLISVIVNNTEELHNQQDNVFYGYITENAPEGVIVAVGEPDYRDVVRNLPPGAERVRF